MRYTVAALSCAFLLSGCASTITSVLNRAKTSETLDPLEGEKLITISGDRRLVRVSYLRADPAQGRPNDIYRICGETQADAIAARTGTSGATLADRGAFTDAMAEVLTKTVDRGEVSDVVRQLAWHWCNAELNGLLDYKVYTQQMIVLQNQAMDALKARAKPADKPTTEEKSPGGSDTADGKCSDGKKRENGKCK